MSHISIDEAFAASIRHRYEDGESVNALVSATGLTRKTLYALLGRVDARTVEADLPGEDRLVNGLRSALLRRMWLFADRQVDEIERRVAEIPGEAVVIERDARTLAVLARVVRELSAAEAAGDAARSRRARARAEAARRRETEDDGHPRTLDELRDELARRLEQLRQGRAAGGTAGEPSRA